MSISSISSLFSNNVVPALSNALPGAGRTSSASATGVSRPDSGRLSPLAQLLSELQQLQKTDPAKYKQVSAQIATNLQNAAQTATSKGDTSAAKQLTQLAGDFTNAASSGQLPDVQDLAAAIGGGHHHHPPATSGGNAGSGQSIEQLIAAFQNSGTETGSPLNPLAIVQHALNGSAVGR